MKENHIELYLQPGRTQDEGEMALWQMMQPRTKEQRAADWRRIDESTAKKPPPNEKDFQTKEQYETKYKYWEIERDAALRRLAGEVDEDEEDSDYDDEV